MYVTVTESDGTKNCAFFTVSNLRRSVNNMLMLKINVR